MSRSGEPVRSAAAEGPPSPATGRRRRLVLAGQWAFMVLVAAAIVVYLARSWDQVSAYDWHVRPGLLGAAGAVFFVFFVLSGGLWWLLLRLSGLHSRPLRAVSTWGVSLLARYLPGSVFMFVGRLWMSVRQGLEAERVTAAMVYEQALHVGGALMAAAVLFPFWEYRRGVTAMSLLGIPLILVVLHPSVFSRLAGWVLRVLRRPPLQRVLPFRAVCLLLAYSTGLSLLVGLGSWLTAAAVTDVTAAALPAIVVAFAVAYVAGMVAFIVPSGLGVREGVLAAAAATALPGGAVALAWALILRLWLTVVELAFVALASAVERATRGGSTGGHAAG